MRHRGAVVHDITSAHIVPKLTALLLSAAFIVSFQSAHALQPPVITYASVVGSSPQQLVLQGKGFTGTATVLIGPMASVSPATQTDAVLVFNLPQTLAPGTYVLSLRVADGNADARPMAYFDDAFVTVGASGAAGPAGPPGPQGATGPTFLMSRANAIPHAGTSYGPVSGVAAGVADSVSVAQRSPSYPVTFRHLDTALHASGPLAGQWWVSLLVNGTPVATCISFTSACSLAGMSVVIPPKSEIVLEFLNVTGVAYDAATTVEVQ